MDHLQNLEIPLVSDFSKVSIGYKSMIKPKMSFHDNNYCDIVSEPFAYDSSPIKCPVLTCKIESVPGNPLPALFPCRRNGRCKLELPVATAHRCRLEWRHSSELAAVHLVEAVLSTRRADCYIRECSNRTMTTYWPLISRTKI